MSLLRPGQTCPSSPTARNADRAPEALARLRRVAMDGGNVFAELMEAVRCCSLGQIDDAFFDVGGQYRRNV